MHESECLVLRDAEKKDLESLHELDCKNFNSSWSKQSFNQEFMHPDSTIKILEIKSRICGFIVFRIFLDELQVFRICCKNGQRNKGYATRLLNAAFKKSEKKASLAFLEVSSNNIPALDLYKKNGFRESGIRNNYYGQGIHALNMTKELSGGLNDCKDRN